MTKTRIRLLYDGSCPLFRQGMHDLARRDRCGMLELEDAAAPGLDPSRYGVPRTELMERPHGITSDERTLVGLDAIQPAYRGVGRGRVLGMTRLGRLLGRDCDGQCVARDARGAARDGGAGRSD